MDRVTRFEYTHPAQQVVFGIEAVARLGDFSERYHWQRLLLCASGSSQRSGHVARIQAALGARLVATYDRVQPHVPDFQVTEVLALAEANEIDAIVGLGGGSPIGMAKAISFALEAKRVKSSRTPLPADQPLVPVIAVPTTYAGSEMTPVYGVTQHDNGTARKVTVTDPRVTPKLAMYDPQLTVPLPPELTASTGINALAHCIEAVYSITRNPLSTAAALSGARDIAQALPRCYAQGDDLEARTQMLVGSYLAGTALSNVTMGLHHGICHILGGTAGVAHGIANSIMLPYVMRFNLDTTAPELAAIGEAMGLARNGRSDSTVAEEAAQRVYDLVREMKLPQQLRLVGVSENDLPRLAQLAMASRTIKNNPKPIADPAQIEALLRAAW
jgi:alcohol dehydrogenase class IV